MRPRPWSLAACAWMGIACGPSVPPPMSSADGSAGSTTSTPTVPITGTSAPGSTSGSSGGLTSTGLDGDTSTTASTTTGEPESVCDPQPQDVRGAILVDDQYPPDAPPQNPYVYVDCTVDDFSGEDDLYVLTLSCADGPHELQIWASYVPSLFGGGPYELSVYWTYDTFGGADVLVALRDVEGLVMAGSNSPLVVGDFDVPADFFAPLSVELLPDVCEIEPEEESETNFIDDQCYLVQRQALRFEMDGLSADIYDHEHGLLGPREVVVQNAEQRHELSCTDTPTRWYRWVLGYSVVK